MLQQIFLNRVRTFEWFKLFKVGCEYVGGVERSSTKFVNLMPRTPYLPDFAPCDYFYFKKWNSSWAGAVLILWREFKHVSIYFATQSCIFSSPSSPSTQVEYAHNVIDSLQKYVNHKIIFMFFSFYLSISWWFREHKSMYEASLITSVPVKF